MFRSKSVFRKYLTSYCIAISLPLLLGVTLYFTLYSTVRNTVEKQYENLLFQAQYTVNQYFEEIEIGRDGLIIQKGYSRGLLLPQVATENKFNVEEFLEHTCMKAGISADSWMDESCEVSKFQGQIFK